jgi:xanthine dehydrogenase small subunit
LLVLDAEIEMDTGNSSRCMPLKLFYGGNRTLNKTSDEIITTIRIPKPKANTHLSWLKVSKRFSLDIATLASGLTIEHSGNQITKAMLSFSGVASTPLYLEKTSSALEGETISHQTALATASMVQSEISPVCDIRGSTRYRRLLARQMVIAHFIQQFPDYLDEASLYEALR